MADALVTFILEQLRSIVQTEIQRELRLGALGGKKEVEKLMTTLTAIRAVLSDAEKKQVKEASVSVWLEALKHISYDLDDLLDEWNTKIFASKIGRIDKPSIARRMVRSPSAFFPCFRFNQAVTRHDIGHKIKHIKERLDVVANEKDRYNFDLVGSTEEPRRPETTPLIDVSEVCGRDADKEAIKDKLLCGNSSQNEKGPLVVSIVGMGGIGKTTLAQMVFNDENVNSHFEKRIWVCVSEPFDVVRVTTLILQAVGVDGFEFLRWPSLQELLCSSLANKRFLLVLDDVRTDDYRNWEPLKLPLRSGSQGSRILVTTRNERVSKMMEAAHMLPLGKLSDEDCWSLFSRLAFSGKGAEECKKLEETGRNIADRCKGLPLAVKTLGSLMRFKETKQDWGNVLESEIWELEEFERGIFPPLLLSYYDLSSQLKRCFSCCAIFPKDYEIEKDTLIKLWMAQGFLGSTGSAELEQKGAEYFDNLVMRSFFQDFKRDTDKGCIISCKMHDIVHDCAQFMTKNECFIVEVGGRTELGLDLSHVKARHMTLIGVMADQFPTSIYNMKHLRTLQVLQIKIRTVPNSLFQHLAVLRTLDLGHTLIERLPSEVGKLIHLRYLDLSYLDVMELPVSICDLYNLQTLNLNWCQRLLKLPRGLGRLINLRHLSLEWTGWRSSMPRGIGRLTALRTLSKFIVSHREGCRISELKTLNHLKGHLEISGLENIADVEETKEADLMNKKHLQSFDLVFSFGAKEVVEGVIEALQPPPNLEVLQVYDYGGSLFPSWMMLLDNLRDLRLLKWENCTCLLPLGKLPSLEKPLIGHFNKLKQVGAEFLGVRGKISENFTGNEDGTESVVLFPKLKELTFRFMVEWEEWESIETTNAATTSSSLLATGKTLMIMPALHSLSIYDCPKLKALLRYLQQIPLQELIIRRCPVLEPRCQKVVGEDWSKISHIPSVQL